jgi:thiol-disulfide isomerase/thioredoxin
MKLRLSACVACACSILALGQGDAAKAEQLLEAAAAVMKDVPAIAFESEIRTGIEGMETSQKATVQLRRPCLARVELAGSGRDASIVLDGVTSWHFIKARKVFVKSPQLGTMKLEQYGAGPLASLFFEKGTSKLRPYLAGATVTIENVGEEECRVIAWTVGSEETRVWVCGGRLRRCRTTRAIDGNKLEQTTTFGALDLAPKIAESAFVFVPPEGTVQVGAGDASKCLAIGAAVPELAATYLDGRPMKLSDFEGKVVLLTFWFHACATCREHFPQLQKLNSEYSRRGFAIVAVDFGDTAETVRAYFEKEKFSFTPALQAKDAMTKAFGVRAYPTTYLIGPDGKVAWRAVGLEDASLKTVLDNLLPSK